LRLLDLSQDVIVQIATFADLTTDIQKACLFPCFHNSYTELAIRIAHNLTLFLYRTDQESFSNLLSSQISISNTLISLFLLFNSSEDTALSQTGHFIGDAEATFSEFPYHVKLTMKAVFFIQGLHSDLLGRRIEQQLESTGAKAPAETGLIACHVGVLPGVE
jgi:hypothetical protein